MRHAAALAAAIGISLATASAWGQTPAGGEFQVNTFTTGLQGSPSAASAANGDFVVTWASSPGQDGARSGIFGKRFSSTGAVLGTEFQVNTYTTSDQSAPKAAAEAAGDFVIVWQSYGQDGNLYGVFGQRFSSNGAQLGTEFQINTYTTDNQQFPSVASDPSGNFVVVWQSGLTNNQDGSLTGIFGQRFSSSGGLLGTEFQVNTYTFRGQYTPSVAADAAGDFVVVWSSYLEDTSSYGVFGQRFSSSGTLVGTHFQVNTYTVSPQSYPQVASDAAGDFVVVWRSDSNQDGSGYGVFGKRFASSGAVLGTEFQVNVFTTSDQVFPAVAAETNGAFLVVWQSLGQDGAATGVFERHFSSTGAPLGSEFQVNTYTTDRQGKPTVTSDTKGDFVVAWQSYSQDGSDFGVFAQRLQGFDVCLQDDKTGSVLQFNSTGGSFQFCCKPPTQPPGATQTGTGTVSTNGCYKHITFSSGGRTVVGEFNSCLSRGNGSLKTSTRLQCGINDSNTTNNTCICP